LEIRLAGIDTPEKRGVSKADGLAAKKYVEDWFLTNAPDGLFILESIKDKTEKYGRFLGIVHSYDAVLNDALIAAGHARVYNP
jgi:micrococcal nuclease